MNTEEIWHQFYSKLKGYIRKRVPEKEDIDDILQDVFLKIHLKSPEISKVENLPGWIYRINHNRIVDHYRKAKPWVAVTDYPEAGEDPEAAHRELATCLVPFVNELPENYKTALLKTDLGGISQKEFATEAGLSYTGAKSQVQRARKQLKELFQNCCTIHSDRYGTVMDFYDKHSCNC